MSFEDTRATDVHLYDPPPGVDDERERLEHERDFWRTLFERLVAEFPEPVLVIDDEGYLTHWNEPHEELLGLSREEVIGRVAHDVIGTEGVEETLAEEIARTERVVREETIRSGRTADGDRYHVRAAGQPLYGPEGEVVGAFEYVTRVTDLVEQRRRVERAQERISEEVFNVVEEFLDSAGSIAESGQYIDTAAHEQVAHLDGVRDDIENLSATIEEIASSAEEVNSESTAANRLARTSREEATEALEMMERVTSAIDTLETDSSRLERQVEDVDAIVDVITDIARQINLLALNANIEAARSGEAGSGFAVVADEIKALANQTGEEVKTIERVIDDVSTIAETTTDSVGTTIDRIENVVESVERVNDFQVDIQTAVEESSTGIDEIARTTDEQAKTAETVTSALDDSVDDLREVVDEIQSLAEANQRQVDDATTVRDRVQAVEVDLREEHD